MGSGNMSEVSSSEEIVTCPSCGQHNRIRNRSQTLRPVCNRFGEGLLGRPSRPSRLKERLRRVRSSLRFSGADVFANVFVYGLIALAVIVALLAMVGLLYVFGWWATSLVVVIAVFAGVYFFFGEEALHGFSAVWMGIGGGIVALLALLRLLGALFD